MQPNLREINAIASEDVVEVLEEILALAKDGKIHSLALAADGNGIFRTRHVNVSLTTIGALAVLQSDLINLT